jgi:hypothetical protein
MSNRLFQRCISGALTTAVLACSGSAAVYHVETAGIDLASRDGKSVAAAWKSLAYACERVMTGHGDTIRLGAGTFVETRPSILPDSISVLGRDTLSTRVVGAGTWTLAGSPRDVTGNRNNYIIVGANRKRVKIAGISFASADTTRRLNGALWFGYSSDIEIADCFFTEFFWDGVCLLQSGKINLHHCRFHNASMQRDGWSGGQILTRWIKDSEFHHNRITRDKGDGYGYKAQDAGHRNVRIHNNFIGNHYFAIESAHDNEYELEICNNELGGCISVPKFEGGYKTLPEGVRYAVRIHHNIMHDSYGIEGPRNFLHIDSNYVYITKTNGRFYTQHNESVAYGPVWIHHNVIVNIDRGFVWAHDAGIANNFHIYNNTVYCADAADRTGSILAIPNRAEKWVFRNNIVIAPAQRPRALFNTAAKGASVVTADHNVFVNVTGAPAGNWSDTDPGLALKGEKPFPYYSPASSGSFVVDKGIDVGLSFYGAAPDIGAYDYQPASAAIPHDYTEPSLNRFGSTGGAPVMFTLTGRRIPARYTGGFESSLNLYVHRAGSIVFSR